VVVFFTLVLAFVEDLVLIILAAINGTSSGFTSFSVFLILYLTFYIVLTLPTLLFGCITCILYLKESFSVDTINTPYI